jgi:DNA-binding IclR family transcriptional regulator
MLVAKIERAGVRRLATWIGKRVDPHCTSLGKCLIAYLPEEDLDRLVAQRGLLRHNENTIVSPVRLKEELARIRALGYALDDEEEEIGVRCIGAPVWNRDGQVIAAVSVAGTTMRINEETHDGLAAQVRQTALAISRQLGSVGPQQDVGAGPIALRAGPVLRLRSGSTKARHA